MIEKMTKQQLLDEIVCNEDGLYEQYNEARLLNDEYTESELKQIATNWIFINDEGAIVKLDRI